MNRIFTLLTLGMLCFALNPTNAQSITANFNLGLPSEGCWSTTDFKKDNNGGPDGSGAATTKTNSMANLTTPFINIPADGTIRFAYVATDNSQNYTLKVSLISTTGTTIVSSFTFTNTSYNTYTSPALSAGVYRVALDYSTNTTKPSQDYIIIDDLEITGSYHYSGGICNPAPTSAGDTYFPSFVAPTVTGNVLTNDTDPNGETLSIASFTSTTAGNLTLNTDGNFSFTPNATFTGGPVTFTYTAIDNGYSPSTSNTATVTINYPEAPIAVNDNFGGPISGAAFSSTITTNDIIPAGKTLIANLVSSPGAGQVVLQPNGSFTYTPPAGFTGGPVSFTYNITYDTYMPLVSNTATVTINYPALTPTPLPIKLLSFTGQLSNNQAVLHWSVDDNETGEFFKVEKSVDGKTFKEAALIFTTTNKGRQEYTFKEAFSSGIGVYYRLQIVNNDAPPSYSKTVMVKPQTDITNNSILLTTNPTQSTLRFSFDTDQSEQSFIHIYTLNGSKVLSQQFTAVKGTNTATLNIGNLPKGLYILEVSGKTVTQRIKFSK